MVVVWNPDLYVKCPDGKASKKLFGLLTLSFEQSRHFSLSGRAIFTSNWG
jgi:hypothetical protein